MSFTVINACSGNFHANFHKDPKDGFLKVYFEIFPNKSTRGEGWSFFLWRWRFEMRFLSESRKLREMLRVSLGHLPLMRSVPENRFSSAVPHWEGGVSMVQGASRGIGLEFVRQLLEKNSKGRVVATCRNPGGATGLAELKGKFEDRLSILPLDVTNERTIKDAAASIKEKYGSLNLLVNTSGVLSIPTVLHPETTFSKLERSSLMLAYEINAIGPVLVVKHMWPLLKAGGGSAADREFAVVANLSARVGSIGDNGLGGWHSYRSSKTALNQLMKTISLEFARKNDQIICILLHPGTVDTDLSKPFQKNVPPDKLFTREFSVQKLLSIINNSKRTDNGKFYAWDGQEIPW